MGYQFASTITDTVTLASGDTVVVKKLGWKAQTDAEAEMQRAGMARLASVGAGIVEMQRALRKAVEDEGGEEAIRAVVQANPLLRYDRQTLLERGIVSWSLSDKPTPAQIQDLDEADAALLAQRIYDLFRPKTEAERKNG